MPQIELMLQISNLVIKKSIYKTTHIVNQGLQVRSWASVGFEGKYIPRSLYKLVTRIFGDEAGDYVVLNVLRPRDLPYMF